MCYPDTLGRNKDRRKDKSESASLALLLKRLGLLAVALLVFSSGLFAQRSGGRGGSRGSGGAARGSGSPPTDSQEMKDFNRLLAIQATDNQKDEFLAAAKSTETARKQAHDLMEQAANPGSSADFSKQVAALKDAVDGARSWNDYFLKSFSKTQESGLKQWTKKLAKAESEVGKERSALEQSPSTADDGKWITATADNMEKALTKFQAEQLSLGDEMGIQTSTPTQTNDSDSSSSNPGVK